MRLVLVFGTLKRDYEVHSGATLRAQEWDNSLPYLAATVLPLRADSDQHREYNAHILLRKYPPKNVASRISRTLKVIEPSGLDIEFARVVMYNTTTEDYLEVAPARLAVLDLDTEFYPGDGSAHRYIWGTRTASAYQVALQYVRYRAPWSYGPRHQDPGWRNVSFQVVNTAAETSNVIERAVWIEGADKILDESWPAYVSDISGMQVWLQEINS